MGTAFGQSIPTSHVILQISHYFRFNSTLQTKTILLKFLCCIKKLWCDRKKPGGESLLFMWYFKYLIFFRFNSTLFAKTSCIHPVAVLLKFWCFSEKRWWDLKKLDRRGRNCKKNGEEENWTNFWRIFLQNHSLPQPISTPLILARLIFFVIAVFWAQDSSFLQTSSTTKTPPILTELRSVFAVTAAFFWSQQDQVFCRLTKLRLEIYEPLVG